MLFKITAKRASYSFVTFVTHKRFAALFFLPSRCVNSLLRKLPTMIIFMSTCFEQVFPGRVLPFITYTGMCRPTGSRLWSSWFRTGYPFQRLFLERGMIFRTNQSSSFVSSHLKLFKDRLLLKIRFNALTSKLLYSCCTLCFSVQGGRVLAQAASADFAILNYEEAFIWCTSRTNKEISVKETGLFQFINFVELDIKNWPISRPGYQF